MDQIPGVPKNKAPGLRGRALIFRDMFLNTGKSFLCFSFFIGCIFDQDPA